jgi:hypothetical protein
LNIGNVVQVFGSSLGSNRAGHKTIAQRARNCWLLRTYRDLGGGRSLVSCCNVCGYRLHTVEVVGSNPAVPTTNHLYLNRLQPRPESLRRLTVRTTVRSPCLPISHIELFYRSPDAVSTPFLPKQPMLFPAYLPPPWHHHNTPCPELHEPQNRGSLVVKHPNPSSPSKRAI